MKRRAKKAPTAPASVPLCDRLVQHNSLRWNCACGASGSVDRSADGIPYVDDEMLRHEPGETKGLR